ncbi:MAG: hypothetical protein JWN52_4678 [Actinomycetia bacterium]|nr:hypothetical protein [Actinomycetes bacterium]
MGLKRDGSADRRHRRARTRAVVTSKVRELEVERDSGTTSEPGPVTDPRPVGQELAGHDRGPDGG